MKPEPYHKKLNKRKDKIIKLSKEGYSVRQIMKELNYKSPYSVYHHIKKQNGTA